MIPKHNWKQNKPAPITKVPIEQVEAAMVIATRNTAAFAIQMIEEQMLIMLHDQFGFGRERCMRALRAIQAQMAQWEENVSMEFSAETFQMRYKEKLAHRTELSWTWAKHDEALEPLVDPEIWRPYTERYKGFGGTGAWCK